MNAMTDPEMELYEGTESLEERPAGQAIPKDLLPPDIGVGTHLVITEDLGDQVKVRVMQKGEMMGEGEEASAESEEGSELY